MLQSKQETHLFQIFNFWSEIAACWWQLFLSWWVCNGFQTSCVNHATTSINILQKEATHVYWSVWWDTEFMNESEVPSGKQEALWFYFEDNQNLEDWIQTSNFCVHNCYLYDYL